MSAKLSEPQLDVLKRIGAREEYVGVDGNERRTARSLVKRKLLIVNRGDVRRLYSLSDAGRKAIGKRKPRATTAIREQVERLWAEGKTAREIAAAVGWKTTNPNTIINTYRRRGWDLPHRQSSTRVGASRKARWPSGASRGV